MSTKKLPSWRPQGIPMDEPERKAYRQLAVQAVFSIWNIEHRPAQLSEIYLHVKEAVNTKINQETWRYKRCRSKRTIDRRVNEAATGNYEECNNNGKPKIIAVTAGLYCPQPSLFSGENG